VNEIDLLFSSAFEPLWILV